MTVLLRVDQPDIILVEKMDDINCLALILNVCQCYKIMMMMNSNKNFSI